MVTRTCSHDQLDSAWILGLASDGLPARQIPMPHGQCPFDQNMGFDPPLQWAYDAQSSATARAPDGLGAEGLSRPTRRQHHSAS